MRNMVPLFSPISAEKNTHHNTWLEPVSLPILDANHFIPLGYGKYARFFKEIYTRCTLT